MKDFVNNNRGLIKNYWELKKATTPVGAAYAMLQRKIITLAKEQAEVGKLSDRAILMAIEREYLSS